MKKFSQENSIPEISIVDSFWDYWSRTNLNALYYQWEQLEKTHCIENFRIAIGKSDSFREGWFFSDSDAYKWLDAAGRYYSTNPRPELLHLIQEFLFLIQRAQMEDGYLYTYNQIFFPSNRWVNLWIEHELYCLGHLIEAIISVSQALNDEKILDVAIKAADLIVQEFLGKDGNYIPGHQEIELALLKLYKITNNQNYLNLGSHFLNIRGDIKQIAWKLFRQNLSVNSRKKYVEKQRKQFFQEHPQAHQVQLPAHVQFNYSLGMVIRWIYQTLSGKYQQQHTLLQNQLTPEGHAVRFSYTHAAIAMLHSLLPRSPLFKASSSAWDHMVQKRMFVTGGLGSIPMVEGFGHDYELNGSYAYCETCAAVGSVLWNWEMSKITHDAKFSELLEWQLYNSVLGGMGTDGSTYLYRNPPLSKGVLQRVPWYQVPCCPSNISRLLADIRKYIYDVDPLNFKTLYINQYFSNTVKFPFKPSIQASIHSKIPWGGNVSINIKLTAPWTFDLHIRIPGWTKNPKIFINEEEVNFFPSKSSIRTASGCSPYEGKYLKISRTWDANNTVQLDFPMCVNKLRAHEKVKSNRGKIALTRGPLVYCIESIDNPNQDIFRLQVDPTQKFSTEKLSIHNYDVIALKGISFDGEEVTAIPFYCWGNRGKSEMVVWINSY
ncbi:MAG: glycoside hydrolase family 127 protein [Candidatus Lokiarchaeota archaeon]|nr:glycoside hydrolase family 127 protein [Candidatus Lokiarchaeota archaeon]